MELTQKMEAEARLNLETEIDAGDAEDVKLCIRMQTPKFVTKVSGIKRLVRGCVNNIAGFSRIKFVSKMFQVVCAIPGSLQVNASNVKRQAGGVVQKLADGGRGEDAVSQRQEQPALRQDVPQWEGLVIFCEIHLLQRNQKVVIFYCFYPILF